MTEIYQFDPERWQLGKLCKRKHFWPGTNQSLRRRRINKPSGGCCIECEKLSIAKRRDTSEKIERQRTRQRLWMQSFHANNGRPSRAKNASGQLVPAGLGKGSKLASHLAIELHKIGVHPTAAMVRDMCAVHLWLRDYKPPVSIADLIKGEQKQYYIDNPRVLIIQELELQRMQNREKWNARYQSNPDLRTYHREKSKRRKTAMRSGHVVQVTSAQLRERFAEFNDTCAYCGAGGHLHIEHVVPISQGGTHTLGNIVPACQACNYSKRAKPVEEWYQCQPFFSATRWRKLGQVLGWGCGSPSQLTLL